MQKPIPYGRYVLLDRIAIGGMAEVYVALRRDDASARLYALKRILPTLAEDGEFIQMFLDEARLVVQLDHPGVVPIHELGKHGEGYYIAMEYVPGRDLRALVQRTRARGGLPVPLAAYLGWRVADALDHAHRKRDARGTPLQIVHRDVSPANVLLGFDGSVRVIDFGIAQAALRTRRDAALRGKFGYMSPEMASGGPVDRRSDVFALGVVLHELLTGARLFTGPSELAVLEKVRRAEVPAPSRVNPAVPRGLDAVVLRALARDPAERFGWASELRDALVPWTHAGSPAGDPPALARFMALAFPDELRRELDRVEELRRTDRAPADEAAPPEKTQVIALRLDELPAAAVVDGSGERPARRGRRVSRAAAAIGAAAGLALAASLVLAATSPSRAPAAQALPAPASPGVSAGPAAAGGAARLVVQPRAAATLVVDGEARLPPLAADETRAVALAPGRHRVELRARDGRRAAVTIEVGGGETAALLGIELQ
jgi:eukaryotic-like serine/threonine-protein kinase